MHRKLEKGWGEPIRQQTSISQSESRQLAVPKGQWRGARLTGPVQEGPVTVSKQQERREELVRVRTAWENYGNLLSSEETTQTGTLTWIRTWTHTQTRTGTR